MKCRRCGKDCKYKERPERKCPHCQARFAFEPQRGDPFTDVAFEAAIKKVSAEGRVRWNPAHLRYELARRRRGKPVRPVWYLLLLPFVIGFCIVASKVPILWFFGLVLLVLVVTVHLRTGPFILLQQRVFDRMWQTWVDIHGYGPGLIVRRPQPEKTVRELPSDIAEYSFDRAVICDTPETVDLLLANNFHFENNCAVLSADGYPKQAFETVRNMLRKNAKLVVYVLHDATPKGCTLAQRIARSPEWFPQATVIDVGLRPVHCDGFRGLYDRAQGADLTAHPGLSEEERTWLSKYTLQLACVLPEQVIKRLFGAVSKPIDLRAAGMVAGTAGAYFVDTEAMGKRAAAADGGSGGDSFG